MAFRRPSNVSCFFCQSTVSPMPQNPRSFRCPHCSCWNRYDAHGEIMSDEPAMHEESLNVRSFAKRASPSKDRLPTMYGSGPFCHTCQTNQMLLMNLLSNYLPPPEDPEYSRRVELLPEYRESLHLRYPPVCTDCLPLVEEEIKKKDHMARTRALGGWLKESKGKKKRQVSGKGKEKETIGVEMVAWRIRGALWAATLGSALAGNAAGTFSYPISSRLHILQPILPVIALVSILWTVWDPTYASFRKARRQGRDVRVRGKKTYIAVQMMAWLSRLSTSIFLALSWSYPSTSDHLHIYQPSSIRSRIYFSIVFALELSILAVSCFVLRLQHPPPIRLINTNSHTIPSSARSTATPEPTAGRVARSITPADPDFLAGLSLSANPIISKPNPIFGRPSFPSPLPIVNPDGMDQDEDGDAMDWTPTNPPASHSSLGKNGQSDSWLHPQRFFAPEHPTGLESLFARTLLMDDTDSQYRQSGDRPQREVGRHVWNWWWVYTVSLVPLAGIAWKAWEISRRTVADE
ncbi:hypothetical protein PLICRDRAFT_101031 [Plicaturopsis crispa FD-325 SS-3]|nr:hypothetical protein PLICRDRAFT_101031 [Plicaturopsis crispa FD-325 SS-3]